MASAPFDCEVITPDGSAWKGRVTSLRLPGKRGSFGILARHAPLVSGLDAGRLLVVAEDGKRESFAIGEGFVEVRRGAVRVLADFLNTKKQINVERARKSQERAKGRLRSREKTVDAVRADAALKRAVARLAIAGLSD